MTCAQCGEALALEERYCSACGADSELEAEIDVLYGPSLASARKWILAVGILYGVSALLMLAVNRGQLDDTGVTLLLGTNFALVGIHVGLWLWARRAPFPAAVVALVLFISVHVASGVLDPSSLYKGILIKVIFLVVLVKAVSAGAKAQSLRRGTAAAR